MLMLSIAGGIVLGFGALHLLSDPDVRANLGYGAVIAVLALALLAFVALALWRVGAI